MLIIHVSVRLVCLLSRSSNYVCLKLGDTHNPWEDPINILQQESTATDCFSTRTARCHHSESMNCSDKMFRLTLLYWILLMSRADWGIPGKLCLRRSKIVSALSSKSSLFSTLTAKLQEGFVSFPIIFLFQMTMEASMRFLSSRILCSVDRSRVERNWLGSKCSTVILR